MHSDEVIERKRQEAVKPPLVFYGREECNGPSCI
jgi:hypothetical protein